MLFKTNKNAECVKASELIREKLHSCGGCAVVRSLNGKEYRIEALRDKRYFFCQELPKNPPYEYRVFDVIVDLLVKQGGTARKGNGRNYRLGYGACTDDTVVGAIGRNYAGKNTGDSVFDPVFVLAAVLDWAGIARNERGCIELKPEYCAKLASHAFCTEPD